MVDQPSPPATLLILTGEAMARFYTNAAGTDLYPLGVLSAQNPTAEALVLTFTDHVRAVEFALKFCGE